MSHIYLSDGMTVTENTILDVGHMWETWTIHHSHLILDGDACQSELFSTNFSTHLDFFMNIQGLTEINTSKGLRFELAL